MLAAVVLVSAVGFTFQYAISGVFNLAYGPTMGLAMLIAYLFNRQGIDIWLALIPAVAVGMVASVLLERGIVRPMLARGTTSWVMMIATFAVGLIIEATILGTWGPGFSSYQLKGASQTWGDLSFTTDDLWILLFGLAAGAAVWLLLHFTQLGRAMRGTAGNPVLAESCGIRTEHVLTLTWLGSGILCGAGGVLFAIYVGSFTYSSWESVLPLIIATAIVGGIGSPQGAMIAAVIVAVVSSVAAGYLSPAFEDVIALGMLTVVMLIRPTGLFAAVG